MSAPPPSPPPLTDPRLHLFEIHEDFFIYRFPSTEAVPDMLVKPLLEPLSGSSSPSFLSVTRTSQELSIVAPASLVGSDGKDLVSSSKNLSQDVSPITEGPYTCIRVRGPMPLELIGVMSMISTPLKEAGVPLFAISTYDTDWLLIMKNHADEAIGVLRRAGWHLTSHP